MNRYVEEKGLDTRLSIDIATLLNNYDVALVVTGDADIIPAINYAKNAGKQVGVVEFIKGMPPEKKGKQFSNKLKAAADFVVQIYEMDLIKSNLAKPVIPSVTFGN